MRPQAVTQLREGPKDTAAGLAASHGLEDMGQRGDVGVATIGHDEELEPICEIGGELMGPDESQPDEPS